MGRPKEDPVLLLEAALLAVQALIAERGPRMWRRCWIDQPYQREERELIRTELLPPLIRAIKEYREGDVFITNDPYSGFVCTHPPDTHLWKPIFWKGELVCFAVGHIHNTDVGGAVPASLSRALTEVHQEGIRFPP